MYFNNVITIKARCKRAPLISVFGTCSLKRLIRLDVLLLSFAVPLTFGWQDDGRRRCPYIIAVIYRTVRRVSPLTHARNCPYSSACKRMHHRDCYKKNHTNRHSRPQLNVHNLINGIFIFVLSLDLVKSLECVERL